MAIKWRTRVVLFKLESVYGTDPTPSGAANAIETLEAEITPVSGDFEELELARPYLGALEAIPVGIHVVAEFGVPLAGGGGADTPAAWAPLLRAAGFAETINAGVDVTYDPVSQDEESGTLYFYVGPNLHEANGCRVAVTGISLPAGGIPRINFAVTGLYVGPVGGQTVSPDFSGFQKAIPVSAANTSCTVHTYSGPVSSVELELGQEVEHLDWINTKRVEITDRQITGTIAIEAPDVAVLDMFTRAVGAAGGGPITTGTLALTHGTVAGNIIEISAPAVQIVEPTYAEESGIAMLELGVRLLPNTGDDDIQIVTK